MGKLGYCGFTLTIVKRRDRHPKNVLIWAGGGAEAMTMERLQAELDDMLEIFQEEDSFKHWTEVFRR